MTLKSIVYNDFGGRKPFEVYKSIAPLNGRDPSMLFESMVPSKEAGKNHLILSGMAVEIVGSGEEFTIKAMSDGVGIRFLDYLHKKAGIQDYCEEYNYEDGTITGRIKRNFDPNLTQEERIRQPNTSYVLRSILKSLKPIDYQYAGIFGLFAYPFSRNFIEYGDRFSGNDHYDFKVYVPSNVVHLEAGKDKGEVFQMQVDGVIDELVERGTKLYYPEPAKIIECEDMSEADYLERVRAIQDLIRDGTFMQCVLSRKLGRTTEIHSVESYERLREINPSPYCFFFDFGEQEYLYGSSPEVNMRIQDGNILMRPLAGTRRRGKTHFEDELAQEDLRNDPKEIEEHVILLDLTRNDVARIAVPGTRKTPRVLEIDTFNNLYHLVSDVRARLNPRFDALDALLSTLPAGTVSGGPKPKAMEILDIIEASCRENYAGAEGYILVDPRHKNGVGNMNTGITIRCVHVKNGVSYVRSGAGIVRLSIPEQELLEIILKAENQMRVLRKAS